MSINTIAKPQNPQFRVESEPKKDSLVPPKQAKNEDSVEIELNVPVVVMFVIAVVALIAGAIYLFKAGSAPSTQLSTTNVLENIADVTVSLDDIALRGDSSAQYVFIEFSDFECPYCKSFATGLNLQTNKVGLSTHSQIIMNYVDTKKMKYGYAPYLVVPSHNPAATNETIGYFCAKDQGKEFEYVAKAFSATKMNGLGIDGKTAEKAAVVALAKEIGLDEQKFTSCYDKRDTARIEALKSRIESQIRKPWSAKFGEEYFGTPAFAVCKIDAANPKQCVGKAFVGAMPYTDMKTIIDFVLGEKLSGTPSPTTTTK